MANPDDSGLNVPGSSLPLLPGTIISPSTSRSQNTTTVHTTRPRPWPGAATTPHGYPLPDTSSLWHASRFHTQDMPEYMSLPMDVRPEEYRWVDIMLWSEVSLLAQQAGASASAQDTYTMDLFDHVFDPVPDSYRADWQMVSAIDAVYRIVSIDTSRQNREDTMLEQLLKLYTTAMATGVTSPMPHFVGPPGAGKSTVIQQLADFVGVELHTMNVSRISPLELEGVQMPDETNSKLTMLVATYWTRMKDGDILLLDEFLRGFPEVYNGLLDILTARQVGSHKLPKVFIIGASNSTVAYDSALEDRLLHLPVPDPRSRTSECMRLKKLLIDAVGLHPDMLKSAEMSLVFENEVLPTYELLDSFKGKGTVVTASTNLRGSSLRKLIGQALLRQVESKELAALIESSNELAIRSKKFQYVVLMSGSNVADTTVSGMEGIINSPKLTQLQRTNLSINLQLVNMEKAKQDHMREDKADDDDLFDVDPF